MGWQQTLRKRIKRTRRRLRNRFIDFFVELGFVNIHRYQIHGPKDRVHLGANVLLRNNVFLNTRSGHIYIGDDTILSFNTMFLTGRHEFENGKLKQPRSAQVPDAGYDIRVGSGCWVASGAIIAGGVTVGNDCIVATGAVVTKDVPDGSIVGGVPARIIGTVRDLSGQPEQQGA
jgi:acetyltransferase-like isoleucine patch superfamily enzyme